MNNKEPYAHHEINMFKPTQMVDGIIVLVVNLHGQDKDQQPS